MSDRTPTTTQNSDRTPQTQNSDRTLQNPKQRYLRCASLTHPPNSQNSDTFGALR
ncbi:MAG: hypothetical protein ACKPBD_14185 [Dolichospermum sp.]